MSFIFASDNEEGKGVKALEEDGEIAGGKWRRPA